MWSVIDISNFSSNNTAFFHVLLTNVDTDGKNDEKNKERLDDNVSKREYYYITQSQLMYLNKLIIPSLKELHSKEKIDNHVWNEFFSKDGD